MIGKLQNSLKIYVSNNLTILPKGSSKENNKHMKILYHKANTYHLFKHSNTHTTLHLPQGITYNTYIETYNIDERDPQSDGRRVVTGVEYIAELNDLSFTYILRKGNHLLLKLHATHERETIGGSMFFFFCCYITLHNRKNVTMHIQKFSSGPIVSDVLANFLSNIPSNLCQVL